ncbi:MAG TPA: hypothetical protein VJG90_02605 [Candidatus Nanoarchaeia archaeon]|nr:hypothetical protein [Candidatus Nanoarchaeia archaeon]
MSEEVKSGDLGNAFANLTIEGILSFRTNCLSQVLTTLGQERGLVLSMQEKAICITGRFEDGVFSTRSPIGAIVNGEVIRQNPTEAYLVTFQKNPAKGNYTGPKLPQLLREYL